MWKMCPNHDGRGANGDSAQPGQDSIVTAPGRTRPPAINQSINQYGAFVPPRLECAMNEIARKSKVNHIKQLTIAENLAPASQAPI